MNDDPRYIAFVLNHILSPEEAKRVLDWVCKDPPRLRLAYRAVLTGGIVAEDGRWRWLPGPAGGHDLDLMMELYLADRERQTLSSTP